MLAGRASRAASSCAASRTSRCSVAAVAAAAVLAPGERGRTPFAQVSRRRSRAPAAPAIVPRPRAATGSAASRARTASPPASSATSPNSYGVFPRRPNCSRSSCSSSAALRGRRERLRGPHHNRRRRLRAIRSRAVAPSRAVTWTSTVCLRTGVAASVNGRAAFSISGSCVRHTRSPGRMRDGIHRAIGEAQFQAAGRAEPPETCGRPLRAPRAAPIGGVEDHAVARLERRDGVGRRRFDGDRRAGHLRHPAHQHAAMPRGAPVDHRLVIRAGEEVGPEAARVDLFELQFARRVRRTAARPAQASSTALR